MSGYYEACLTPCIINIQKINNIKQYLIVNLTNIRNHDVRSGPSNEKKRVIAYYWQRDISTHVRLAVIVDLYGNSSRNRSTGIREFILGRFPTANLAYNNTVMDADLICLLENPRKGVRGNITTKDLVKLLFAAPTELFIYERDRDSEGTVLTTKQSAIRGKRSEDIVR